jgi:mannan endo-1,4-beta-mannosidase
MLCTAALAARMLAPAAVAAEWPAPANPKASPGARAVLAFFHGLTNRTERRVLSGQFANFGEGANLGIMEQVHTNTGKWPALLGVDYADFGRGRLHWANPNKASIAYWKAGGLVTVSAHLYNPANPNGGGLRDKGVDLATLLDPASPNHERWMKQLDELAQGLQELKDAGVVVLWRPFHEMNGGWFWWGAQKPEDFIKVWRHMFDYFSQTKNLDNLLWVYGPNHGPKTAAYYAGDACTDLVGIDAYTDHIDPEHIRGVREVVALGKPFGFTEYGPFGPQNPPGDYDYRRLGDGLEKHFPEAVFFMSWNAKWSLARNRNVAELLGSPRIANRDDLPKDWGGR